MTYIKSMIGCNKCRRLADLTLIGPRAKILDLRKALRHQDYGWIQIRVYNSTSEKYELQDVCPRCQAEDKLKQLDQIEAICDEIEFNDARYQATNCSLAEFNKKLRDGVVFYFRKFQCWSLRKNWEIELRKKRAPLAQIVMRCPICEYELTSSYLCPECNNRWVDDLPSESAEK